MGVRDTTSAGGSLGSNRLENINIFIATADLVLIAAARLVALALIARRLSADEAAAPALVTRLDTGVEDSLVDGRLPARVFAAGNVQGRVASLDAHHVL